MGPVWGNPKNRGMPESVPGARYSLVKGEIIARSERSTRLLSIALSGAPGCYQSLCNSAQTYTQRMELGVAMRMGGMRTCSISMSPESECPLTASWLLSLNQSGKLRSQMTANAEVLLEEKKGVLAIPEGAIVYKKDKSTEVEIPDPASEKGRQRIAVVTGISNGSKTEVVRGLKEGQQVILQ